MIPVDEAIADAEVVDKRGKLLLEMAGCLFRRVLISGENSGGIDGTFIEARHGGSR